MIRQNALSLKSFKIVELKRIFLFLIFFLFVYAAIFTLYTEEKSTVRNHRLYTKEIILDSENFNMYDQKVDLITDLRMQNITMMFPALSVNDTSVAIVLPQALSINSSTYINNVRSDKE